MAMQNMYNYQRPKVMPKQAMTMNTNKAPQFSDINKKKPNKSDGYLEQKIMSAKPEELTAMLYDGIIRFIKQAMLFNEQKHIEKTNNAILRAQAIINELNVTLNMDYAVSENLELMYDYMNRRLLDANIEKKNSILEEVLEYAVELKDTWQQAIALAQ